MGNVFWKANLQTFHIWGGFLMGLDILLFLILGLFVGTFGTLVGIG